MYPRLFLVFKVSKPDAAVCSLQADLEEYKETFEAEFRLSINVFKWHYITNLSH